MQRTSPKASRANPIDISAISQTDTGVVKFRKGTVYVDMSKRDGEPKPEPKDSQWVVVVVRDPYGNVVEMVRNSDTDDEIKEQYINNQARQSNSGLTPNNERLMKL
jgi:hypothetical protein